MESNHCFPPRLKNCNQTGRIPPIAEYGHSEGISVTGGFVYRGQKIPSLNGKYIFGDYGSSRIWTLTETEPNRWKRELLLIAPDPISSFGENEQGELYVIGYNGTIFQLMKAE